MYNLLISLVAAAMVFLAVIAARFAPAAAIIPALIAFAAAFFLLSRRVFNKVKDIGLAAQREAQARRIPQAIKVLEEGFRYQRWQFFVASEIHANIGILHYLTEDFDAALPHLQKSFVRNWLARAMLACLYYRRGDQEKMRQTFEETVKAGKKESLAWATYAWCEAKLGHRDEAMRVLARAVETNPTDDKLKKNLGALQNDKKMKMRGYEPGWFQFHLEPLPHDLVPGGRRMVYQRR